MSTGILPLGGDLVNQENSMERRGNDPTNTHMVPVLDREGRPLMPTRPSRARRLLRDVRATKVWRRGVFAIQMLDVSTDDPDTVVDGVEMNIDPGASATGMAVVSERDGVRRAHALIELRHRGSRVRNRMERRRSLRRNRRSRLRNRPPRFDNRTRPAGWLAPSLVTRLENTVTWVSRLMSLFPVRLIRVEDAVFDTQMMADAEISGEQYQQGDLLGWQLRSYVFHRDGRRCVYCSRTDAERYELDHVVPRSLGGSDRVSNLVVSCRECNARKGNRTVADFLAERPDRLAAVRRIQGQSLAGAAHLNVIVPELLGRLGEMGVPVSTHDSYTTSWTRRRLGVGKTHVNDALCLGTPMKVEHVPERKLVVAATGRGDRQMLRPPDRHGNPRGQGYRDYCALPRQQQGHTRCPGHRAPGKRAGGIGSGDLVRFRHRRYGVLTGYGTLINARTRVALQHDGRQLSVRTSDAIVLAHNHGYRVFAAGNTA